MIGLGLTLPNPKGSDIFKGRERSLGDEEGGGGGGGEGEEGGGRGVEERGVLLMLEDGWWKGLSINPKGIEIFKEWPLGISGKPAGGLSLIVFDVSVSMVSTRQRCKSLLENRFTQHRQM